MVSTTKHSEKMILVVCRAKNRPGAAGGGLERLKCLYRPESQITEIYVFSINFRASAQLHAASEIVLNLLIIF